MFKRTWTWLSCSAMLVMAPVAGCGDEDRPAEKPTPKPFEGTFLGKVSGTNALLAVVAAPAAGKEKRQAVRIYVSDGSKLSQWLDAAVERNSFTATDRDAEIKGQLNKTAVKGTITLPGGKTASYSASRATGAAGLYELTVSPKGKITGASATGIGLTGKTAMGEDGSGTLKLADGTRHKFDVDAAASALELRSGELRVIVLGDGELRGAGRARGSGGFFIRSS